MNGTSRTVITALMVGTLVAPAVFAQRTRRPPRGGTPTPIVVGILSGGGSRVITIPVGEAATMAQRQRVWFFVPPAGSSAFRIGTMGEGRRVWALLPSCRQPNPDDPRDPCPVDRASIEVIAGQGQVASTDPIPLGTAVNTRRVQSFVVPNSVEQVRLRILRRDNGVRWEAAVEAGQLFNLPAPEGQPAGPDRFNFALQTYPAL